MTHYSIFEADSKPPGRRGQAHFAPQTPQNEPVPAVLGCRARRRGVVLVIVLVTISISLALFALWAQTIVQDHRRLANEQFRLQAVRLAEAGIRRAMARRAADPQFKEEVWLVPAEHLGGTNAAKVRIRATPNDESATLRYEATAEFPVDAIRRAQVTKRMEVATPPLGNES